MLGKIWREHGKCTACIYIGWVMDMKWKRRNGGKVLLTSRRSNRSCGNYDGGYGGSYVLFSAGVLMLFLLVNGGTCLCSALSLRTKVRGVTIELTVQDVVTKFSGL